MFVNVLGLFETPHEAQLVVNALIDSGIPKSEVSLILPDQKSRAGTDASGVSDADMADLDQSDRSAKRVSAGMGAGAAAGGALGLLAGIGAFAIPGLGPILAAGPIVAALEGAGFGAIAGGLAGTLSDVGIPENKTEFYGDRLKEGHALVMVHSDDDEADKIYEIMEQHGAIETAERVESGDDDLLEENHPVPPMA